MGHLNGILARVGGNLNNNFQNSQINARGVAQGGGMLKLRFDRYINGDINDKEMKVLTNLQVSNTKLHDSVILSQHCMKLSRMLLLELINFKLQRNFSVKRPSVHLIKLAAEDR